MKKRFILSLIASCFSVLSVAQIKSEQVRELVEYKLFHELVPAEPVPTALEFD